MSFGVTVGTKQLYIADPVGFSNVMKVQVFHLEDSPATRTFAFLQIVKAFPFCLRNIFAWLLDIEEDQTRSSLI
jgi:hypothetical protein